MKNVLITMFFSLLIMCSLKADAQIIEAIKEASRKVIRAVDLAIQRQQNKVIWLQNAQKELENKISKLKLDQISTWAEKSRKLYDDYFKELWKVKSVISTYKSIKEVIDKQLQLVQEYKRAWGLLKSDRNFNPEELRQMFQTYTGILDESIRNLDQLLLVTNSFATQMSDGKRLEFIDRSRKGIDLNLFALRQHNHRNYKISISRTHSKKEAATLRKLYGF